LRGCDRELTGLELAEVCQQSYMSVMDITVFPPQGSHSEILRYMEWMAYREPMGFCVQAAELEIKAETAESPW